MMIPYFKYPIHTNFMFFNIRGDTDESFKFSTDLEKIGTEWDVEIKNGTFVEPISEPVEIDRPKYGGMISVIKIRADVAHDFHTIIKEFWIPTSTLINVEQKPNEQS
jgi:hypothetical protein